MSGQNRRHRVSVRPTRNRNRNRPRFYPDVMMSMGILHPDHFTTNTTHMDAMYIFV